MSRPTIARWLAAGIVTSISLAAGGNATSPPTGSPPPTSDERLPSSSDAQWGNHEARAVSPGLESSQDRSSGTTGPERGQVVVGGGAAGWAAALPGLHGVPRIGRTQRSRP